MTPTPVPHAIAQMRSVVLIIGLAWLCIGVPLVIGVASVGGAAWTSGPVQLALAGCVLAAVGAMGTWLLYIWGPITHVLGAALIIVKNVAYASATSSSLTVPWAFLFMSAIFIAVVAPNWSIFRSHHA